MSRVGGRIAPSHATVKGKYELRSTKYGLDEGCPTSYFVVRTSYLRISHRAIRTHREGAVPAAEGEGFEGVNVQVDAEAGTRRDLQVAVHQAHWLVHHGATAGRVVGQVFEDQEVRRAGRHVDIDRRRHRAD